MEEERRIWGPILGRDEVRGVDEISGKEYVKNKLDFSNFAFLFPLGPS